MTLTPWRLSVAPDERINRRTARVTHRDAQCRILGQLRAHPQPLQKLAFSQ
jgi:hypothetical protein